jgi:hypothetical protein
VVNDQDAITQVELVRYLVRSTQVHELAARVPPRDPHERGRPRRYPMWTVFHFNALVSHLRSATRVAAELDRGGLWDVICEEAFQHRGEVLCDIPMTRHAYGYWRTTLTDAGLNDAFGDAFIESAVGVARTVGLLDPEGPGSPTKPTPERIVNGDGVVIRPISSQPRGSTRLDKATGEVKARRADPDAMNYSTGTGDRVYGNKAVMINARGDERNQQVTLGLKMDKSTGGGEAGTAVALLHQILPHTPGALGLLYDGAMRGTHIRDLQTRFGLFVMARMHVHRRSDGPRQPKQCPAGTATHRRADGSSVEVNLYAVDGRPYVSVIDINGDLALWDLEPGKVEVRAPRRPGGTYRHYRIYYAPTDIGGGTIRVRFTSSQRDRVGPTHGTVGPVPDRFPRPSS